MRRRLIIFLGVIITFVVCGFAFGITPQDQVKSGQNVLLVGKPLPGFDGTTVEFSAEAEKKQAVIVCFFDISDGDSQYFLVRLALLAEEMTQKDVTIVAIAGLKTDPNMLTEWEGKLAKWAKATEPPFRLSIIEGDEDAIRSRWGVRSLPWLVLTDKERVVKVEGIEVDHLYSKLKEIGGFYQETKFEADPNALSLYNKMIETMRQAKSLSWQSTFTGEAMGLEHNRGTYTAWLKKPNYFRVETVRENNQKGGTLVGDGDYLWIYWPEDISPARREKLETEVYMNKSTPLGRHSIGHEVVYLNSGLAIPIIDPSTFHGYDDSLQPYIDGAQSLGVEKVNDEICDVIEVSFMKRQRSRYFWLSRRDHLPRKLKQVVRVRYDIIFHETWSNVTINGEIANEKFVWSPPASWRQWREADIDDSLLKPRSEAPDFE